MTDIHGDQPRRWPWILTFWGAAAVGLAALVYVIATLLVKPVAPPPDLKTLATGDMANLAVKDGGPPPTQTFLDADGAQTDLSKLKSGVVVVNLWATWCPPCVREMPTLAKLQAAYPGKIIVAPISMDAAKDRQKARAFIAKYEPLPFYQDPKSQLVFAITPPADGLPTTIIYDRTGRERARLAGGADWSGPDAHKVVDALLAQK